MQRKKEKNLYNLPSSNADMFTPFSAVVVIKRDVLTTEDDDIRKLCAMTGSLVNVPDPIIPRLEDTYPPEPEPRPQPEIPFEFIDLGLPSGTLWANKNLGAATPEDFGNFYCYGEPYYKDAFPSKGLLRIAPNIPNGTGYTVNYGPIPEQCEAWRMTEEEAASITEKTTTVEFINKTNIGSDGYLPCQFDAAYVTFNEEACMPSSYEIRELFENTNISILLTDNNIKIAKFTNKNDDSKFILIPFSGSYNGNIHYSNGSAKANDNEGFSLHILDALGLLNYYSNPLKINLSEFKLENDSLVLDDAEGNTFNYGTIGLPIRAVKHLDY